MDPDYDPDKEYTVTIHVPHNIRVKGSVMDRGGCRCGVYQNCSGGGGVAWVHPEWHADDCSKLEKLAKKYKVVKR